MTQHLAPTELRCWQRYLHSLPDQLRPVRPRVTAGPAGSPDITDDLVALYLDGTKTAGSSLVADLVASGDRLPEAGDHWICCDSRGVPRCILRTERVETHRFADVPERIAVAEGEGDRSLEHWRRVHADHWQPYLQFWGVERIQDADVVTEFFSVVHIEPADG